MTVDLDLGARPFAEQHAITFFDIDGNELAGVIAATRPDGDNLALRGFFLSGVRDDDAAGGFLFGLDAPDDDAVVKRTKLHGVLLRYWNFSIFHRLPAEPKSLSCAGVERLALLYREC